MNNFEKIITIDSEWHAQVIEEELKQQKIPYLIRSYHDSALDGLFENTGGWGHVEAPIEFKNEIIEIADSLHTQPVAGPDDSESDFKEVPSSQTVQTSLLIFLFFVFTIACLLILRDSYIRNHYCETIGRVMSVSIKPTGQRASLTDPGITYSSHLVIAYQANGKEVLGEADVDSTLVQKGDKMVVLYSKDKPKQCLIRSEAPRSKPARASARAAGHFGKGE